MQEEKDARKRAKLEEIERKERIRRENEEFAMRMKAAASYHNQQLLIKYGIIPFANLILELRYKERQAVLMSRKLVMRRHFKAFVKVVREIRL